MKPLVDSFNRLQPRERLAIVAAVVGCLLFACYLAIEAVSAQIASTTRLSATRQEHLEQLYALAQRYKTLDTRLEKAQTTFAESQLTFEEVTSQLDSIVRQSIGSSKYDLDRGRALTPIGLDYQKQEFTLKVTSLSLEQVIDLLYRLEHGESPLLLGKVDLFQSGRDKTFSATLEIFSVLRAQ